MSQVFISYKSEDESWAERVADTLENFGVNVWRDHAAEKGIRVSYKWDDEIRAAIGDSTTMLVLWSKNLETNANSVAHREMQWMEQVIRKDKTRRFITLVLDNAEISRNPILGAYHAESSLQNLYERAGPEGAWSISDPEWYSAMLRALALFEVREVVEVRYAIGAMTRRQAVDLMNNPATWAQDESAWKAFQAVRKMTAAFDPGLYGDTPDMWTPFPHIQGLETATMGEVISRYDRARREYMRNSNKTPNWVLVSYSDGLLSEDLEVRRLAREALRSKCLIVLDPVSLLHKSIYQNLVNSWGLQARENAFVIGLSACEYLLHTDFRTTMPEMTRAFRSLLDSTYDRFAQSFQPEDQCVLEIGNHDQFARWLQVAGDGIIAAAKSPLRFGSMSPAVRNRIRSLKPAAPGSGLVMMGGRSVNP